MRSLGVDTLTTSWQLLKITIPIIILTKIMTEAGLIVYLSMVLDPVMNLMGLPGALGFVWATALVTNIYAAMVVFVSLAAGMELTAAQVTVLCSIILIAHSLPVELSITKKAGGPLIFIGCLRVFGAIVFGVFVFWFCEFFSVWQEQAPIFFQGSSQQDSLVLWALGEVRNIALIIVAISCILLMMRLFRLVGLLTLLERGLAPVLPLFGMSRRAAPVTVVGMIMGITYGGALIIQETRAGRMGQREITNSLALMGLSHALVEDTLLMLALGSKFVGVFWGRIFFSLLVMYVLVKIADWRYGFRKAEQSD